MKGLIVAVLAFALVAFARYKIFELDDKPTAKLYDKPVWLRQLSLPEKELPEGYTRAPTDNPRPVKLEGAYVTVSKLSTANLPQQNDVQEVLVQSLVSRSGQPATIVTARYPNREVLERLAESYKAPHYLITDVYLTWFDAVDDDQLALVNAAFAAHAKLAKDQRTRIEKAAVGSNAMLKFFADLMVGAFGFVLALFFTKYFLIVRTTEE